MDKKPPEYALEYAGFWIRLGAGAIDLAVLVLIHYVIYKMVSGSFSTSTTLIILIVSFIILSCAYLIGFWTWRGQTPGKMITGIKVIRTNSSPFTFPNALLRYLGYIVSTLIVFIGFILIAVDTRKQGLHDRIADTYVVKLPVRQVTFTTPLAGGEIG